MSTGALENIPQEKSGRATALPAPPPPRSLPGDLRFFSLPSQIVQMLDSSIYQVPVVHKVDSAIGFPNTYPVDSDLSCE